jgi:hypothetical protein
MIRSFNYSNALCIKEIKMKLYFSHKTPEVQMTSSEPVKNKQELLFRDIAYKCTN